MWEKILAKAGLPLEYPPAEDSSTVLGFAARPEFKASSGLPFIPLAKDVREAVEQIHTESDMGRRSWLPKLLPSRDTDADVLDTPLCPEACFERMSGDKASRRSPLKPTPQGVQGPSSQRRSTTAFTVGTWNRSRDEDLRRLENLARDGVRVANTQP
jgi:hypothetical protein